MRADEGQRLSSESRSDLERDEKSEVKNNLMRFQKNPPNAIAEATPANRP